MHPSKKILLMSGIGVALCAGFLSAQEASISLTTDLNTIVQHIEKVVFATPDNGAWKNGGQVSLTTQDGNIIVDGSFITNVHQNNSIPAGVENVSLLGGEKNKVDNADARDVTIIGGTENAVSSEQAFVVGGTKNKIT